MEGRVASLENEISKLKASVEVLRSQSEKQNTKQDTIAANQEKLMDLFTKSFGKDNPEDGESSAGKNSRGKGAKGDAEKSSFRMITLDEDALNEFRQSMKKIELPTFTGEDPAGWISRAEIYFQVQNTSEALKVSLAQICMEGGTIHFFNSLLNDYEDLTWEDLKRELMERYGGIEEGTVFEQLTSLRQIGTVEEYIRCFESLVAQVPRLMEGQYFAYFTNGLREDIRARLRSLNMAAPLSRGCLMNTTQALEAELAHGSRGWQTRVDTRGGGGFGFVPKSQHSGSNTGHGGLKGVGL